MQDETDRRLGIYRRIYSNFVNGRRINSVSVDAEALFWRLHALADDWGNLWGDPRLIQCHGAPRRSWTFQQVEAMTDELVTQGLIVRYDESGETYLNIVGWEKLQPANKNGKRLQRFPRHNGQDTGNPGESKGIQVNPENPSESYPSHSHSHSHSQLTTLPAVAGDSGTVSRETVQKPEKARKQREPNPVWDAIVAEWGLNPQTKAERSHVGALARDMGIKLNGHDPTAEIKARRARYRREWPTAADTADAVLKHWDRFGEAWHPPPEHGLSAPGYESGKLPADAEAEWKRIQDIKDVAKQQIAMAEFRGRKWA